MKAARLLYTPTAQKQLQKLHPEIKRVLREAIEELATEPLKGKPLHEDLAGFRSHRMKRYRVVYRYDEKKHQVEIIFAGPRRDIYRLLSDYLRKTAKTK